MRKTDWTAYYSKKSRVNQITRNYVQKIIINEIHRHCVAHPRILEAGGANSCFFNAIYQQIEPSHYAILDNNSYGLDLFNQRTKALPNVCAINKDMLSGVSEPADMELGDLVFSTGLIEHFDLEGTQKVISSHFMLAKPGGIVLFTFPTPTKKYQITRRAMELFHIWKFFDERPLLPNEVLESAAVYGDLLENRLLSKMPLTQQLVIYRKKGD